VEDILRRRGRLYYDRGETLLCDTGFLVYSDIERAFDDISPTKLIYKIKFYGIMGLEEIYAHVFLLFVIGETVKV